MKRLLLFLLGGCLLLAGVLTSCGKKPPDSGQVTSSGERESVSEGPETGDYEYLPAKDLNYNWRLLMIDGEAQTIFETEESAKESAVGMAYYRRDEWMKERYRITLEAINSGGGAVNAFILNNQLAMDDLYDIAVLHTNDKMAGVVSAGLYYDIKTLPYVDLSKPYYFQQANEEYTILGKQVMMVGDYPCCGGGPGLFLFNKTMMDGMGMEYPYATVMDGDWTLEEFYRYCRDAYQDSDGIGGKTEGDTYGYAGTVANLSYMFTGLGGSLTAKDENGAVVPTVTADRNDQVYAKLYEIMKQPWCYIEKDPNIDKNLYGTKQWFDGRTLFHYFLRYATDLIDINHFDYGLAVNPKLDEDQRNYEVMASGGVTVIAPTIRDPETVGYILEAFGQITHTELRPALIDELRDHRILRDAESLQVYKMTLEHLVFSITKNVDPSNVLDSNTIVGDCLVNDRPSLSAYAQNIEGMIKNYYSRFYYGK
ncbi:MAG: hypothetical protein SOZ51_10070 [Eubacteriales bacterium]|nr:hypothetical protein [Eubacteriales bacterium]